MYYIKWNNIQQSLYVAGNCGLQFTDNLGTAVAKASTCRRRCSSDPYTWILRPDTPAPGSPRTRERLPDAGAAGCRGPVPREQRRRHLPARKVSTMPRERARPGRWRSVPSTPSKLGQRDAFVRADWEYQSRNNWLAAVQDPHNNGTYFLGYSYTLPSTRLHLGARGRELWRVAAGGLLRQTCLIRTPSTTTRSARPTAATRRSKNAWTFRPRTVGLTFTWHGH